MFAAGTGSVEWSAHLNLEVNITRMTRIYCLRSRVCIVLVTKVQNDNSHGLPGVWGEVSDSFHGSCLGYMWYGDFGDVLTVRHLSRGLTLLQGL